VPDFNTVLDRDGNPDEWIESELFANLDDMVARALRQVVALPPPAGVAKQAAAKGWHASQFMSRRFSMGMAMWVGAQAVRSPAFRQAVTRSTTAEMQSYLRERVQEKLEKADSPEERDRLNELAGVRFLTSEFDQNALPNLSAELAFKLGEVLYREYTWAIQRFAKPVLVMSDDPVVLMNVGDSSQTGSYSAVATRGRRVLSLWMKPRETIERAAEVMKDNHLVLMPLTPKHLLTLSPTTLMKPGRYDAPDGLAKSYNAILLASSSRWTVYLPQDADRSPHPARVEFVRQLGQQLIRREVEARMAASTSERPRAAGARN
jgi:hypothetical protein